MKRLLIQALIATLALLLALAASAVAQTGPEIPWSVIASGGADLSGAGSVIVDETFGQPIIGPADGGTVQLDAGYRQQLFAPEAVDPLSAAVVTPAEGRRLRLNWTAVGRDTIGHTLAGVTYETYRALDAPYFTPGTPRETGWNSAGYTDPDETVLTSAGHGTYYVVRAVYNGLGAEPSNRVGAFVFALTR